ncbi:ERYTHROCYTE MEMBRANE PROTEIN PFEMP3, partial [Plasmodium yoelii yoelii]
NNKNPNIVNRSNKYVGTLKNNNLNRSKNEKMKKKNWKKSKKKNIYLSENELNLNVKKKKKNVERNRRTVKKSYKTDENDSHTLCSKKEIMNTHKKDMSRIKKKMQYNKINETENGKTTVVENEEILGTYQEMNNKKTIQYWDEDFLFKSDYFFEKKLNKTKGMCTNNIGNNAMYYYGKHSFRSKKKMMLVMKKLKNNKIKRSINDFIKNNSINNNNIATNNKCNIYSFGKGNYLYSLERINYNNEKSSVDNKIKLNFGDIETEQCELICKCVQKNINHTTDKNRQINKYNLFIVNKSTNNSTILNDVIVDVDQVKDEDSIFLGINEIGKKNNSKYVYKIKYNKLANIFNINNGNNYTKDNINTSMVNKSKKRKGSKIVSNNFSLNNMIEEDESKICILIFLIINKNSTTENGGLFMPNNNNGNNNNGNSNNGNSNYYGINSINIWNEPIYTLNNLCNITNLNITPKKSLDVLGYGNNISTNNINNSIKHNNNNNNTPGNLSSAANFNLYNNKGSTSINKMIEEDSPNTQFNESIKKINKICQSRISPLCIKDSIKKDEKIKGLSRTRNNSKELPVTLLNACAELCKEINKNTTNENNNVNQNNSITKNSSLFNNPSPLKIETYLVNNENKSAPKNISNMHNNAPISSDSVKIHKNDSIFNQDPYQIKNNASTENQFKNLSVEKEPDINENNETSSVTLNKEPGSELEGETKNVRKSFLKQIFSRSFSPFKYISEGGEKQTKIVTNGNGYNKDNNNNNNNNNNNSNNNSNNNKKWDSEQIGEIVNLREELNITPQKDKIFYEENNEASLNECKEHNIIKNNTNINENNQNSVIENDQNNVIENDQGYNKIASSTEKGVYSLLYSKNSENKSYKDCVLCLKNDEEKETYLKIIGEIKVKRNATFSEIKQEIDSKLMDKSTGFAILNSVNYSIHLNAFSEKINETKFNELSALHLDYIDNTNFSDIDTLESFELKKMIFIKYEE